MANISYKHQSSKTTSYEENEVMGTLKRKKRVRNVRSQESVDELLKGKFFVQDYDKLVEKKNKLGKRGYASIKRIEDALASSGYEYVAHGMDPKGSGRPHLILKCPNCGNNFNVREDHFTSDKSKCPRECEEKDVLYVVAWKDPDNNERAAKFGITSKTSLDRARKTGYGTGLQFIELYEGKYKSEAIARDIEKSLKKIVRDKRFETTNKKFKHVTEMFQFEALGKVLAHIEQCKESLVEKENA